MSDSKPSDDARLDEALQETFPASDPPANTVETGAHVAPGGAGDGVVDNRAANRFELTVDGHTAILEYSRTPVTISFVHTEVPPELRGRKVGERLVEGALAAAKAERLGVVAICPFVRAYLKRHPEALESE